MLPKIIFDISGINALEDGGAESAPLMRRLAWDFEVILTCLNLEEIISTQCAQKRAALVCRFNRMLRPGKCLLPPSKILRLMVSAHVSASSELDWKTVDVSMPPEVECLIGEPGFPDNELCSDQRIEQRERIKEFEQILKSVRPALHAITPSERPGTFEQYLAIEDAGGPPKLAFGHGVYVELSGNQPTDLEYQHFIQRCPPWRALFLGQDVGFYYWSLQGKLGGKGKPPGRNDLLMAAYLPYCDQFITNDPGQRFALCEVARTAEIPCQVLAFDEFAQAVCATPQAQ
jgi:hypothetical protein